MALIPYVQKVVTGQGGDPYGEGVTNIEKYRMDPNKYKGRGLFYEVPKSD